MSFAAANARPFRNKHTAETFARDLLQTNLRAAQYLRMSTGQQQYSISNQTAAIERYARRNNIEVVATYVDCGKSGLSMEGRYGLQRLLRDVQSRHPGFDLVLVYDISRWGRFQDIDESAFYEYQCKRSGIRVYYCAEPFADDGSITSHLLKTLKRAMAGEFSRKLSKRVFAAKCRMAQLGFLPSSVSVYGYQRQLVDTNKVPKEILKPGEQKALRTDRVILIPGLKQEINTVRRIFDWFTEERASLTEIVRRLNQERVPRVPWKKGRVARILCRALVSVGRALLIDRVGKDDLAALYVNRNVVCQTCRRSSSIGP
jgi:DNA invertase Pin-like site-specific DNA recombinase